MAIRHVATVGILAASVACSRVREVFEPARFIADKSPSIVYVTQRSGAVLAIANPRVSGDSVLGILPGEDRVVSMPFSDVHSVSAMRLDGGRTALLAVGVAAAGALTAYAFFGQANGNNNWYCDYTSSTRGPAGEPICGPVFAR